MKVWNYTKTTKATTCWYCDHFQRYDGSAVPTICQGDCRFEPPMPICWGDDQKATAPEEADNLETHWGMWPTVPYATRSWCGHFERTQEKNLPAPPEPETCRDPENPPEIIFSQCWEPWNKKEPEKISCWNCDHFQVDPYQEEVDDYGNCRRNPAGPSFAHSLHLVDLEKTITISTFMLLCSDWPELILPSQLWCAQWERARHTVPAVPGPPRFKTLDLQNDIGKKGASNAMSDTRKRKLIEQLSKIKICDTSKKCNAATIKRALKAAKNSK